MKWGRITLVVIGALVITALGIDAADTFTGSRGTLLSQVIGTKDGECPHGMAAVATLPSLSCVDMYEVSPGGSCPEQSPENVLSSLRNIEDAACIPDSKKDGTPWRYVTRDQAMQACARTGKRLPTSAEWYTLSLGMTRVHESCNINSRQVANTGFHPECVSPIGAYDMVGNVWEWVSDDVIDGKYHEQTLPEKGFVTQVDSGGMATLTGSEANELFGSDYFWAQQSGAFGIIRGGYYDSGTDAGVYTVHADTLPTTAGAGIGFRCVQ